MIEFKFIKTEISKRGPDGTIRIYGPLLDELDALERGKVLELTNKAGRKFVVAHWDDVCATDQPAEQPIDPDRRLGDGYTLNEHKAKNEAMRKLVDGLADQTTEHLTTWAAMEALEKGKQRP